MFISSVSSYQRHEEFYNLFDSCTNRLEHGQEKRRKNIPPAPRLFYLTSCFANYFTNNKIQLLLEFCICISDPHKNKECFADAL